MTQDEEQKARISAVNVIIDASREMPLDHLYRIATEQCGMTETEQQDARTIPIRRVRKAIERMELLTLKDLAAYMVGLKPGDNDDGWNLRDRYTQPDEDENPLNLPR